MRIVRVTEVKEHTHTRQTNSGHAFVRWSFKVNIASLHKRKNSAHKEDVLHSKSISNVHIHVKRVIGHIKCFKIL